MALVGEQLRGAREAQGLSINQVAEVTKIRADHIRALEAGDYSAFVAPVYVRGFVRTYSNLLKVETAPLLQQLDAEMRQSSKFQEMMPQPVGSRGFLDFLMLTFSRVNWSIVAPVVLAILLIALGTFAYRAWRLHQTTNPLSKLGPGLYQPKPEVRDLYLPVPTNRPGPVKR